MHQIFLSQKAQKNLSKLNANERAKVLAGLLDLRKNPKKCKQLAGRYKELFLFSYGKIKIICDLDLGQNIIFIIDIGKKFDFC